MTKPGNMKAVRNLLRAACGSRDRLLRVGLDEESKNYLPTNMRQFGKKGPLLNTETAPGKTSMMQ